MVARRTTALVMLIVGFGTLTACVSTPPAVVNRDSGPEQPLDVSHIPDAVPRVEPRTRAGNKSPYTVLGKTYHLMESSANYREQGVASWYGRKFHGRLTSNGEVYDMYGMTAAHKNLPIPTFVRVKNLDNNREVIVRVNDRGPFHEGRIIDLSYAAAKKLDFVNKGIARVEVTAIDPVKWAAENGARQEPQLASSILAQGEAMAPTPKDSAGYALPANTFLQAGAFGSEQSARVMREKLLSLTSLPVFIAPASTLEKLFRVRIGPISDNFELLDLKERIEQLNLGVPHVVQE